MRFYTTYTPAISLVGVGYVADYNHISHAPLFATFYQGNEIRMSYNDIDNVCRDMRDSGAIYTARDWSTRGCEVSYLYIHDMRGGDPTTYAVCLDDSASSTRIIGNVFERISWALLLGGGRHNVFEKNVVIDCVHTVHADNRGEAWASSPRFLTVTQLPLTLVFPLNRVI